MGIQIVSKSKAFIAAREVLGDHRKLFESTTAAIDALKLIYANPEFPAEFPTVAAGVGLVDLTAEDSIPPLADWPEAYRADGGIICVSFLGVRKIQGDDGKEYNGARGFVIMPLHGIDAIRAEDSGDAWLWKIIEKEEGHVALRGLRGVDSALGSDALAAAAMQMPLSVADYVEESTREGLDTSAFDDTWKQFRKLLAESPATAAMVPGLPTKGEVLKSIRSKAYAAEQYPDLESINAFVFIAESMARVIDNMRKKAIAAGKEYELDSTEMRGWLTGRDTKVFPQQKVAEFNPAKVDFGAFMAGGLLTAQEPAADSTEAPATAE